MGQITECEDALIRAIRQSEEYLCYEEAEKALQDAPDLREGIDRYRLAVYRIQNSGEDLFDQIDQLEREYSALLQNPAAAAYLNAESRLCRLLQGTLRKISECLPAVPPC